MTERIIFKDERLNDLRLLPFTDPLLRKPLEEFDFEKPPIDPIELKDALILGMTNMGGVGLSANQIGLPFRCFVYGMGEKVHVVFNPKIIGASTEKNVIKEGCLSLPGVWLMISRPAMIAVVYQDETGESKAFDLNGISSRVFQHEFDHMEGRNFTMLASPLKLQRALAQLKKKVHNERAKQTA